MFHATKRDDGSWTYWVSIRQGIERWSGGVRHRLADVRQMERYDAAMYHVEPIGNVLVTRPRRLILDPESGRQLATLPLPSNVSSFQIGPGPKPEMILLVLRVGNERWAYQHARLVMNPDGQFALEPVDMSLIGRNTPRTNLDRGSGRLFVERDGQVQNLVFTAPGGVRITQRLGPASEEWNVWNLERGAVLDNNGRYFFVR
jgi:hypothetical protein